MNKILVVVPIALSNKMELLFCRPAEELEDTTPREHRKADTSSFIKKRIRTLFHANGYDPDAVEVSIGWTVAPGYQGYRAHVGLLINKPHWTIIPVNFIEQIIADVTSSLEAQALLYGLEGNSYIQSRVWDLYGVH